MKHRILSLVLILGTLWSLGPVSAQELKPDLKKIVDEHILPGYQALVDRSQALEETASRACGKDLDALKAAYNDAFDAWISVSHMRFGPAEQNDRAYALAYWPDSKGFTPKTLASLLKGNDPVIHDLDEFQAVSIAGRGFYALEFLLYDKAFVAKPAAHYCDLVTIITEDIAANARDILADWQNGYADILISADNDTYRSEAEVARQLYTTLTSGLQFTSQTRIGRPMGSFKRPRPRRAEVWRSGRSVRHVVLSLEANRQLAALLSDGHTAIDDRFARAILLAEEFDDPIFAGVGDMQGRIRVEALQTAIDQITIQLAEDLAPKLGIAAGFNSLDGD
ncbi:imelysin family protein [uncultured Cohaesibacter sp.]|uniref:imelysin family protein n=1 Tax=uncultured Cohaesibacter sp. TaxID=1002546 RepID=UPI0029C91FD5|nr:imelysin family protein [uncultured Cohaesibacter sp.]